MDSLIVQPYEWKCDDRDGFVSIRIWAHDENSERVLIRIDDYQAFCRLELPLFVNGIRVKWNEAALRVYAQWLRHCMKEHAPSSIVFSEMSRLYMYNHRSKFPFLTLRFTSLEAMSHCTRFINAKPYNIPNLGLIKGRIWEQSIQTEHRMITELGIGYCKWLEIKAIPEDPLNKISTNGREYIAKYKDIKLAPEDKVKGWVTRPKIAAVDIECYSTNHRAMPNKLYSGDIVTSISYVVQQLGSPESRERYLLIVGKCPSIPDATVLEYSNEIEMIQGLCQLINQTDPSLIVGYNTYKFDYPYLDARLKLYMMSEWPQCGLIKDNPTYVKTKTWKSSAYGFMTISTLEAEGRLSIDMFPIIKRDHKLDRYTLDFVANTFLKRGKHDVSPLQMFQAYQQYTELTKWLKNSSVSLDVDVDNPPSFTDDSTRQVMNLYVENLKEMRRVGEYNLEDSVLCIDLMEKLNTWTTLIETSNVVSVTIMDIFTRGQQIRVQNQVYAYAYKDSYVLDERSGGGKFMGANVVDPIPGKYKNIIILDFASLYPTIIIAYNICYTTLVGDDAPIADEDCHVLAWEEADDNGIITKHRYRFVKKEIHHGILPRMCENLIAARKSVRKQMGPQNDSVTENVLDERQKAIKVSTNSFFGALGVREGRMPLPEGAACITAMGRFLSGKAAEYVQSTYSGKIVYGDTDSIMVDLGITDPHECEIMGNRLAEEISALFMKPLKIEFERALSVALFIKKKKYAGVKMLTIIKNDDPKAGPLVDVQTVEEVPFDPIWYQDSLKLWRIEYTETIHGKTKTIEKYLGVPINIPMTIDRPYFAGIPLTDDLARYPKDWVPVGTEIKKVKRLGAPDQGNMLKKGIVLARRDNCVWLKKVYMKVLLNILFDKPLNDTLDIIDKEIIRMMSRSVPFLEMSVTREIGSNYKPNSSYPLKVFSDELRQMGHPIQGGDRIDYIFVVSSDPAKNTKQGYKMRLHEHFWQNYEREPLDTTHYVEKILGKPIEQILYLGYKDIIDQVKTTYTPVVKRRNRIYTFLSDKYITSIWYKMLNVKSALNKYIRDIKPHFPSQEPYYSWSFL